MGQLKWRPWAAVIGYLDVLLSLIEVIGTIVGGAAIAVADHKIQAAKKQPAEALKEALRLEVEGTPPPSNETVGYVPISPVRGDFFVPLPLIWVSVGLAGAITALHLVTAVKMLKATEANYHPIKAIWPARMWLYLNVLSILVSAPLFVFIFGPLGGAGYGVALIMRLGMMCIVNQFKKELVRMTNPVVSYKHSNNRIGPTK